MLPCINPLSAAPLEPIPDKTVVLTFDDSVKSHRSFVAPLLKEHGFGATFFVTALWMDDTENFMVWEEIAELHEMGFEIGNHSWSHHNFSNPKHAASLAGQLALVENELKRVGVPKPTSFAWCGNAFSPEGAAILRENGYLFARRGMQPEIPYGQSRPGPLYNAAVHHPLLIPSAGDAYPDWNLDHFKRVVDRAKDGEIAMVQFHGVPDIAHPWVHTPPELFKEYMDYLKQGGFNVIALRDLSRYVDPATPIADAMSQVRYPALPMDLAVEASATRANFEYWLGNMRMHQFTDEEAALVFALPLKTYQQQAKASSTTDIARPTDNKCLVLPYPGGRHPRIGFLDGAIDPLRGTKASVFSPNSGYALVDIPEAIFSNLGLIFLAHTHIPTYWDMNHTPIENKDWSRKSDGSLENEWVLPNKIRFGACIIPAHNGADLELWLENGTDEPLSALRTQICVMLKGLPGFDAQCNDNKNFTEDTATALSTDSENLLSIQFEHCTRTWGNPDCPCIHADPTLPDCAPGKRVSVKGALRFKHTKSEN